MGGAVADSDEAMSAQPSTLLYNVSVQNYLTYCRRYGSRTVPLNLYVVVWRMVRFGDRTSYKSSNAIVGYLHHKALKTREKSTAKFSARNFQGTSVQRILRWALMTYRIWQALCAINDFEGQRKRIHIAPQKGTYCKPKGCIPQDNIAFIAAQNGLSCMMEWQERGCEGMRNGAAPCCRTPGKRFADSISGFHFVTFFYCEDDICNNAQQLKRI